MEFPSFDCDDPVIERAFRIAVGDTLGNVRAWSPDPARRAETPCLLAGLDYDSPWTRDAAFNCWYALSWLAPEVARSTLDAVLVEQDGEWVIGGEYWDAIIWLVGAWTCYLFTGDRDALVRAESVGRATLIRREAEEWDERDGLFRGGACFQDGVAGYPDCFADGPTSGIADWVAAHPDQRASRGHGLPLKALSTNLLYLQAYRLLPRMAAALGRAPDPGHEVRVAALREAIEQRFWNSLTGRYRYLVDADDSEDREEGLGVAFAVLFGQVGNERAGSILAGHPRTAHGVSCVWPPYERYAAPDGQGFGRHCGTIWPQVNAAWALAAVVSGRPDLAWSELKLLATKAVRDGQFMEIYHPLTGLPYGGLQEGPRDPGIRAWKVCQRQSWCATGYLAMVLGVLGGMALEPDGISFVPWLPPGLNSFRLRGLRYRETRIDLAVRREAAGDGCCRINGKDAVSARVPAEAQGRQELEVTVIG
jgi:glycogen debranching enzyme